jgi:hypothetical protein
LNGQLLDRFDQAPLRRLGAHRQPAEQIAQRRALSPPPPSSSDR